MNFTKVVTPSILISDQPTEEDLKTLSSQRFAAVVNLREDGEPEQHMGVADEGKEVKQLGMAYHHMGVGSEPLSNSEMKAVSDFLDRYEAEGKSVLVHCRKGGRAAAIVFLQQARKHGWGPKDLDPKSAELGLSITGKLREKVEEYLAHQQKKHH